MRNHILLIKQREREKEMKYNYKEEITALVAMVTTYYSY